MSDSSYVHDLTKGPIGKQLWSLAWPMMLSMFFYTLYGIVDTFWVSKVSPEAIAAVSISQLTLFVMIALSMGLSVGSSVLMSMSIGAKNMKEAGRLLGQAFALSTLCAVFFTIICLVFRHPLLTFSGATGAIMAPALSYFTVTAAGSVLFFWLISVMFAFNSEGDTFTVTKMFALSTLVNVVLDPLFIFGYGIIPPMGVAGAAYATLVSQAVFVGIGCYLLSRHTRTVRLSLRAITIRIDSVKQILRIGIPASLTQVINPVGTSILVFLVSSVFSEAGAITFSLVYRIEFFAFLPAIGFGFASMAMIGQSLGAGDMQRARTVFKKAVLFGASAAFGFGILAMIFGVYIIKLFTTDQQVITYSLWYLWIVGISYGFLAATMIQSSVFQSMRKSWTGFWIMCLKFFGISFLGTYVVTMVFDAPIYVVWIVIAISNVVAAIVGYILSNRLMNQAVVATSPAKEMAA